MKYAYLVVSGSLLKPLYQGIETSKPAAKTCAEWAARQLDNAGIMEPTSVYRMAWSFYRSCRSWDAPTFAIQADRIL